MEPLTLMVRIIVYSHTELLNWVTKLKFIYMCHIQLLIENIDIQFKIILTQNKYD